ncbi:hypothetical protein [Mycobacteroides abscessus]|uniref:hypothetical protein n=1 Tax=Mycobacteroides abscessus TaxID=36809 RepID=UPI0003120728|nr:hypothetical protein [Mycobacteroides abscessus]
MRILVENHYSDGYESKTEIDVDVEEPTDFEADGPGMEDLWDQLRDHTGDGHGIDADLGFCYTVTILDAASPELIGKSYEWIG